VNDREKIAWLHRRVGFGLAPGQLDQLEAKGVDAVLDELVDPDGHGVPAAPDPWAKADYSSTDPKMLRQQATQAIGLWLTAMTETPRPLVEWMRWFWHGHFVSTIQTVKLTQLMVDQLRLFETSGLGDFRTLLRAVTVDPAMLIYLDGTKNQKNEVNENYGRELLELFSLGIGNYGEDDVRSGAVALTGWTYVRQQSAARFAPKLHDDTKQNYLGRTGVHDVDSVIDAVVGHDACPTFITGKLAKAMLGPDVDRGLVTRLATDFKASGLQLRPLVRAILEAGLDGASTSLIMAPVPWFTGAVRATAAPTARAMAVAAGGLVAAGQLPMNAPNVAGWPGGTTWLSSSATVARFNMAASLAAVVPKDGPAMRAAGDLDLGGLATALGHPDGFGDATSGALDGLGKRQAAGVLTVALAAPELVMA
jgi:uncharacterized protein (DUF1800 family)